MRELFDGHWAGDSRLVWPEWLATSYPVDPDVSRQPSMCRVELMWSV